MFGMFFTSFRRRYHFLFYYYALTLYSLGEYLYTGLLFW